jgi:hypothetical protein
MFFFEKKNQKTSPSFAGAARISCAQMDKSFFASFFSKKEDSFFPC